MKPETWLDMQAYRVALWLYHLAQRGHHYVIGQPLPWWRRFLVAVSEVICP